MAYQNVGTPRFFIDNYQYLRAIGLDPEAYMEEDIPEEGQDDLDGALFSENSSWKTVFDNPDAFTLDPMRSKTFRNTGEHTTSMKFHIPTGNQMPYMEFTGNMRWYCAILNHNINGHTHHIDNIRHTSTFTNNSVEVVFDENFVSILNGERDSTIQAGTSIIASSLEMPQDWNFDEDQNTYRYTGFKIISHIADTPPYHTPITEVDIGAISMGVMYTMPNSADLKLTMSIENDGYKSTTTSGGSTLTNIRYTGSPSWTNGGEFISPFGVAQRYHAGWGGNYVQRDRNSYSDNSYLDGAKRNGRRSWNLKFSYMSDKDLFSSNYTNTRYLELDGNTSGYSDNNDLNTEGNEFEYNIFTDDSFIAQVWNKTLGGALPFIFQPDSNNNQPDQFCLAQFDMDTLKVSQAAFQTYDISVKIVEVW